MVFRKSIRIDESKCTKTDGQSVTHIICKIFNCIFFPSTKRVASIALFVCIQWKRSRTNGDIANARVTSTQPITNHSRGTIKQNRGKKFPSKVSCFICTQRGPAVSVVAYNCCAKIKLKAECCGKSTCWRQSLLLSKEKNSVHVFTTYSSNQKSHII